jgi:hypothetical protein
MAVALSALPATEAAQAGPNPYHYVSPIFSPKTATSFTLLMTSGDDASQPMLLRRYDAVGTLLSSQTVTIGAHGSLQASPAAHSGAPLHVELWSESPAILARITYTDSADVTQRITEGEWGLVGPENGVPAAVAALQGTASSVEGTVFDVRTSVGGLTTKLDAVATDVTALRGQPAPTPDARVAALQTQVTGLKKDVSTLRSELRSLRRILLYRIPARRRR